MDYQVTLTLSVSITAGNEDDGNEELAQARAEQLEAAAMKGIATIKAKWLGELESELDVEEE